MRRSVAAVIAASAALSACHMHGNFGGGATVSRNYQVGNFQELEVAEDPMMLKCAPAPALAFLRRVRSGCSERTVVEVEGDKLSIHPENDHGFFHFGSLTHGHAHFIVTVPQLTGADDRRIGRHPDRSCPGPTLRGTVAGSGGLDVAAMDVQQLKLSIAGSGGVKARRGQGAVGGI